MHDCLDNFQWLLQNLSSWSTHLYELVPQTKLELIGAGNMCSKGTGGMWFPISNHVDFWEQTSDREEPLSVDSTPLPAGAPLVRCAKFLVAVMQRLFTTANPKGTITNLGLELAASFFQKDITAHH
jgi:hypothetical protein